MRPGQRQHGFSLLEMIIALVILALSLGMLYQATAGATRNVRVDERYVYAVLVAQSLLAEHPEVRAGGVSASGNLEDYRWRLDSELLPDEEEAVQISLYQLTAEVEWPDGDNSRQVHLVTVVPEALDDGGN